MSDFRSSPASTPDGTYRDPIYQGDPWSDWLDGEQRHAEAAEARKISQALTAPRAVKLGPMEFPLHGMVEPWPSIIYDVNAYYARLGISPRATRLQIREAYFRLEAWRSPYLHYAVMQLLDPAVRRRYDACQPGSLFFDAEVEALARRRAHEASLREHGRSIEPDELASSGEESIDWEALRNRPIDLDASPGDHYAPRWRWGFYLWRANTYDVALLSEWMRCLCSALAGQSIKLSVGLMEGDEPVSLVKVGYRQVAFINVNTNPTVQLAQTLEHMING